MNTSKRVEVTLKEFETMLHSSVQRVGRAVKNLRQEMGGYSSKTPGSGEPGSGKNSQATVTIRNPHDDDDQGDDVPVTSVEVQALHFAGIDTAAITLDELRAEALKVMNGLRAGPVGLAPAEERFYGQHATPGRLVVFCYYRVRRWQQHAFDDVELPRVLAELRAVDRSVHRIYDICQRWGYTPGAPVVTKDRAELLAVDLTEQWCTSHLRAGDRRPRFRGELCEWCYRHGPLLVATWEAPPLELVRLHIDKGKVYAHQVEPFLKAERNRQRQLSKANRS